MRVVIAGGRDFDDYALLKEKCDQYLKDKTNLEIISGKAKGADTLAERYAKENNIPIKEFPLNYALGKYAPLDRNKKMAEYAVQDDGFLILFWDGVSKGSKNMLNNAKKLDLKIKVFDYEKSLEENFK